MFTQVNLGTLITIETNYAAYSNRNAIQYCYRIALYLYFKQLPTCSDYVINPLILNGLSGTRGRIIVGITHLLVVERLLSK